MAIIDVGLGGENVIQPPHGGRATLKNIGDPAESDHRPDELCKVPVKSDQSAERNLAAEQLMPSLPQHNQKSGADQRLKRRHKHTPGTDETDVPGDVLAIGLVKCA